MSPLATNKSNQADFPWWLVALGLIFVGVTWVIVSQELYTQIIRTVSKGVSITIFVTLFAFTLASAMGLGLAVMSLSKSIVMRQVARFYIEVVRGIPILVLLFYIAFVGAPGFVWLWNVITAPLVDAGIINAMGMRDFSLFWRAVIALTIGYSAFIAEVFRAGIQAVDKGQIEAAQSMGLGSWHRFRLIILPQALRTILPPLGNDFIAMVKDSSLVSILGVADVTQMGKVYAEGSFRFFETYSIVAYIYLIMTVTLSIGLRALERRMRAKWK